MSNNVNNNPFNGAASYQTKLGKDNKNWKILDKSNFDGKDKLKDAGFKEIKKLTQDEFKAVGATNAIDQSQFEKIMGAKPGEMDKEFKLFDTDGDGKLQETEFARGLVSMDKDQSGDISEDERSGFQKFIDLFKPKPDTDKAKEFDEGYNNATVDSPGTEEPGDGQGDPTQPEPLPDEPPPV